MDKKQKRLIIGNMTGTGTILIAIILALSVFLTWGWYIPGPLFVDGFKMKMEEKNYVYKYRYDDDTKQTVSTFGNLIVDIDWAVPGKLYKLEIEITNNIPKNNITSWYQFSVKNLIGKMCDFEATALNLDENGDPLPGFEDNYKVYYEALYDVFGFYKFVVEEKPGVELSQTMKKNPFNFAIYDGDLNERYAPYFEGGKTFYCATFREIALSYIGEFEENSTRIDGKTVTTITMFLLAEGEDNNKISENMFQESIYEGNLLTTIVKRENP